MTDTGYIKLNRKFFQNFLWNEARVYSRAEAWIDLIQLARFEVSTEIISGKVIEVQRSELPASRRFLELRWDWGSSKVSNFLKTLSDWGMISIRQVNGQTIVKLCNYDVYNYVVNVSKPRANHRQTTGKPANEPETNHATTSCSGRYDDCQTTDKPPNKPPPNHGQTSGKPATNQRKEGEERKNLNLPPYPPLGGDGFDFSFVEDDFGKPFGDWLEYKKNRKESYKTQQSLEACYRKLKKLSGGNPQKAGEVVEQSMANNWAGLFELSGSRVVAPMNDLNVNDIWKK